MVPSERAHGTLRDVAAVRRITVEERRARLARRHRLAPDCGATSTVELANDLVGLHATDPATVFLSQWARIPGLEVADVERALYDERSVVRQMAMRRTLWTVPVESLALILGASSLAVAAVERRRVEKWVEEAGLAVPAAPYLARLETAALNALDALGGALARELPTAVPELATKVVAGSGKWATEVTLNTRVLGLLNMEGKVMRGRPSGTWLSSLHRWETTERWLSTAPAPLDPTEARTELARRYLAAFGPATVQDVKWWTGWTLGQTRAALAALNAVEVDLDGATGVVLADDLDAVAPVEPWVALLPGLDPTTMGWKEREWYLGDHKAALFDTAGNAGLTIWCDGRIVGGWGQRKDGSVVVRFLEDVGADAVAAVEAEAQRLDDWLGGTRIAVRFPMPLRASSPSECP